MENSKVLSYARSLLDINKERHTLESRVDMLKEQIARELMEANTGQIVIPIGGGEEIVVRNNLRFTKPFDKDGLAGEAGVDRGELHYAGVASFVDAGEISALQVEKYQSEGRCEFVTVRVRKAKMPKKKRDKVNA